MQNIKEKFIKEKCTKNIAGEPIVACSSADWIYDFFEPYISSRLEPLVSQTEPTPICNNCKHFIRYDLIKNLQSACINKESEAKWISNPEVYGCTYFEKE